MASYLRHLVFAKAPGAGPQIITGIGFRGTAALFWSTRQTAPGVVTDLHWTIGATDGVAQACRDSTWPHGAAGPVGSQAESQTTVIEARAIGGTAPVAAAAFTGFTHDGFTLDWSVNDGRADLIHVLVIHCTAAKLLILPTTGITPGDVQSVVVGFPPDAVLWIPGESIDGVPYAVSRDVVSFQGPGLSKPGASNYMGRILTIGTSGPSHEGSKDDIFRTPIFTSIFVGYVNEAADISGVTPNGFTLVTHNSFGVQPHVHFALCLRGFTGGGIAGGFINPAAVGNVTIPIGFRPRAVLLHVAEPAFNPPSLSVGAWDEVGGQAVASLAVDYSGTSLAVRGETPGAVVRTWTPGAGGTATDHIVAEVVSASDTGFVLHVTARGDGTANIGYLAFGGDPIPAAASCSGGTVPTVPDPIDGDSWVGLGPHTDRVFVELDLDSGQQRWALHDPMNDDPALAHGGRKDGRLLDIGAITRRTTDRLGGWQTSTGQWTADDHDRVVRGLIDAGAWYNREFRVFVANHDRIAAARCLGRFILREYPPGAELQVSAEGVDIIGSEFSQFALDRDVLASVLFDKARVPGAPKELIDAKRPIPIYMGVWSDESSSYAGVPVWKPYPLRGGLITGTDGISGFGDLVSAAMPPTTVTASALPGGSLDPADTLNDEYGFLVTAIDAAGKESDPYPFHVHANSGGGRGRFPDTVSTIHGVQAVPKATIAADGTSKIRVTWSGATGAVKYRCYLGSWYYLARWSHYIETAATSCEFVDLHTAPVLPAAFTGPNIWYYVVIAKLLDGLTGKSTELTAVETGPRRIVRGWFTPIAGATEYLVCRRGAGSGFTRQWTIPDSQREGGWVYFDDDQLDTTATIIDTLPVPTGMIPITDIGDEPIAGASWGKFAIARWAWRKVIGVYAGGVRLSNTDPNVLHADHPSWPFPARTRPLGDCDCMVIYLRGTVLNGHRDGSALVKVNGCTTEDAGDGSGSTITNAARGVQHLITELVLNDHTHGLWAGIPLFADGVPMVRSSSYARAEVVQIARVGGTGYTIRAALDQSITLRDVIQNFVQSFGLHHGINRHGQIVCGHYDDAIDASRVYPAFTDAREIVGDIGTTPRTSELETTIPYQHTYQPADQSYLVTDAIVEDAAAVTQNRGKVRTGPQRTLAYTADATTITDVIARALMLGRSVRQWLEVPTSIVGLNVDLFDVVRITDEAGIGRTGYHDQALLVLEHEVKPPAIGSGTPLTVALRGLDITALLDTAWAWGPDSITNWDTMSQDERGTWGAWATDADVIPSDLSDAREWR